MPNITYSIKESGGPEALVGIRAIQKELSEFIRDLVVEAAKEGEAVAVAEAPRGYSGKNSGHRISDAIRTSDRTFHPGGQGGGGTYQVELIADAAIAPQLQYVWEGTGEYAGKGNIRPTRGNVLVFEGDDGVTHFATQVRGQRPQTEWWERAEQAMDNFIQSRIRSSGLGEPVRK